MSPDTHCRTFSGKRADDERPGDVYVIALMLTFLLCAYFGYLSAFLQVLVVVYFVWVLTVYKSVLTFNKESPNPEIPETVRMPLDGLKWDDYDYSTEAENTNIFFFMFTAVINTIIAPYETLIYDMSTEALLVSQELNHAAISTNWNKQLEKQYGIPLYSVFQKKFFKNIMFNYLKPNCKFVNTAIGCGLEAMFCWIVYVYNWQNGFIYRRMNLKTWLWSFHLLEEIEHTHLSVPEMREELSIFGLIFAWIVFDLFIVTPILLVAAPICVIRYFPGRFFHPYMIVELVEYLLFIVFAVPFVVFGQFCEMVLGFQWKATALQDLWKKWYQEFYVRDCIVDGKEIFRHIAVDHGHHHHHHQEQTCSPFVSTVASLRAFFFSN